MIINNLSDLPIEVHFVDDNKEPVAPPSYDFVLEYFTHPEYKIVRASKINGVYSNCSLKDGVLHCSFDNPKLGPGRLFSRKTFFIPDDTFPDRKFKFVAVKELDVDIAPWPADEASVLPESIIDETPVALFVKILTLENGHLLMTEDGKLIKI